MTSSRKNVNSDRLAFALKWDLLIFLWLAAGGDAVSQARFWTRADRKGLAFEPPGPAPFARPFCGTRSNIRANAGRASHSGRRRGQSSS